MIDEQNPDSKGDNATPASGTGGVEIPQPSGNANPDAHNSGYKFRIRERFAKWREQREVKWKNTPIHDRTNVRLTRVIAVSTVLYTIFAGWTLWEIHSSSADTHNLAVAAATQASHTEEIAQAAQDQVDAADEISEAADSFSETADVAVEEFKKAAAQSAAASEKAAHNAERTIKQAQDSFRDEQRAWVVAIEINPPDPPFAENVQSHWSVTIINTGKTPAMKATPEVAAWPYPKEQLFVPIYTPVTTTPSVAIISPGARPILKTNPMIQPLDKDKIERAKGGSWIWYVYGQVGYEDVSGRPHHTTFCYYLNQDLTTHSVCSTYNEAD